MKMNSSSRRRDNADDAAALMSDSNFRRRSIDAAHEVSASGTTIRNNSNSTQFIINNSSSSRMRLYANNKTARTTTISAPATTSSGMTRPSSSSSSQCCPFTDTATRYYNRHVQTVISLSLFSYMGEFLRYFTEELFGLACHDPGSVGWNLTGWAPCTTAPGTTDATGGALFTDLPANMLGCFIMGLVVSGDGESVSIVDLPVAMLPRNNRFQQWTITHVGIRTGFCGALTTFASWNTQMITMICGGDATMIGSSQWVSAIFGYIIGLFIAIQSFLIGRDVAYMIGRWNNPDLAKEADRVLDKKEIGILVNRKLPDFERWFLHDLLVVDSELAEEEEQKEHRKEQHALTSSSDNINDGDNNKNENDNSPTSSRLKDGQQRSSVLQIHPDIKEHIDHLRNWKTSTKNDRVASSDYVRELHEIETNLLLDNVEPRQELLEVARDAGWDIDALRNWSEAVNRQHRKKEREGNIIDEENDDQNDFDVDKDTQEIQRSFWDVSSTIPLEAVISFIGFLVCTGLLIWGVVAFDGIDDPSTTYRKQFLSALLSPPGTLTRWYLSRLNGKIKSERFEWLPIGTLLANTIGSIISALMAALSEELKNSDDEVMMLFFAAIKAGYAGSLSTVSTFAAESVGLFRALPRYWWGYYYISLSLFLAIIFGLVAYTWSLAA